MALVVADMSVSLDGYVIGPNDSRAAVAGYSTICGPQIRRLRLIESRQGDGVLHLRSQARIPIRRQSYPGSRA